MSLFAIADIHFGKGVNKSMDIFGGPWVGHMDKIIKNWRNTVTDGDTVLIPGDICWAKKLPEAKTDMEILQSLPGKKVLLEGNHDYWWDSQNKVTAAYPDMFFLKNNFYVYNETAVCGTRGWLCPNDTKFTQDDLKVYNRECGRLKISLDAAVKAGYEKIIVIMHYPPVNDRHEPSGFTDIIESSGKTERVLYGHLHGRKSIEGRLEGKVNGVEYTLVSADHLDFRPLKIL